MTKDLLTFIVGYFLGAGTMGILAYCGYLNKFIEWIKKIIKKEEK